MNIDVHLFAIGITSLSTSLFISQPFSIIKGLTIIEEQIDGQHIREEVSVPPTILWMHKPEIGLWQTSLRQNGKARPVGTIVVSIIKHVFYPFVLKNKPIFYHLRVPSRF